MSIDRVKRLQLKNMLKNKKTCPPFWIRYRHVSENQIEKPVLLF